jgi:hypothetical protein
VRHADHGGLGDLGMGDERAFDFGRAHAVAGDVDHVVDTAGDPVIAVLVAAAAVAGEILAAIGAEIGLEEALVIAPDGAHLARPAVVMHRLPSVAPSRTCLRHRPAAASRRTSALVAEPGFSAWRRAAA